MGRAFQRSSNTSVFVRRPFILPPFFSREEHVKHVPKARGIITMTVGCKEATLYDYIYIYICVSLPVHVSLKFKTRKFIVPPAAMPTSRTKGLIITPEIHSFVGWKKEGRRGKIEIATPIGERDKREVARLASE